MMRVSMITLFQGDASKPDWYVSRAITLQEQRESTPRVRSRRRQPNCKADATPQQAEDAIEAILRAMPPAEVTKRLEDFVASNQRLARAFATHRR